MILVSSNHASSKDSNLKADGEQIRNSSHQNNKAHKEATSLRWTSTIQYHSDDKTNPAEAGFVIKILKT